MMSIAKPARSFERRNTALIVCATALSCASVSGWHFHNDWLFLVGLPGDIVMMLMTGVHGGGTYAANLIGGIAGVLVNIFFFYYLFSFIAWLFKR